MQKLNVQAVFVRHELAVLHEAAQQAQVHRPAIAGDTPMLVLTGPADVVEVSVGGSVPLLQMKPDARAGPVDIAAGHLQLEGRGLYVLRDFRAPVVLWPKPQLVLGAFLRLACGSLGPPRIETFRRAHVFKDARHGSLDQKIMEDVSHAFAHYLETRSVCS